MNNTKMETFFRQMQGKRIAFCGIGGSNLPLVKLFHKKGAQVAACDKRPREALGAAAGELEQMGIPLHLGETYLQGLDVDILFRTPGMPFTLPELTQARQKGIVVTSEMEVFFDLCPCKIYGVTGSDGKTTTTTILAEFLRAAGKTVHLGGNIGRPLLPEIEAIGPEDVAVVELSSFQLISMRRSPDVAVVTNLSPNHLDVHKDMEEYVQAKKNIFLHQTAFSKTVLSCDNELTRAFFPEIRGQALGFSRRQACAWGAWRSPEGKIYWSAGGERVPVLDETDIRLPGRHNLENYLAAIAAAFGDVPPEAMRQVAKEFAGVPHRAELVRVCGGVSYYNDSIATSPTRTIQGTLSMYPQKILLIAGGYDKHIPYDAIGPAILEKAKALILLGDTAEAIQAAVENAPGYRPGILPIVRVSSMEEAVEAARSLAKEGDIVSLSPASASFDRYPNFEARGNHFKELVQQIQA